MDPQPLSNKTRHFGETFWHIVTDSGFWKSKVKISWFNLKNGCLQAILFNGKNMDNIAYWLVLLKHKWNMVVVRC